MNATPDSYVRRRRRAIEVSTLVCRAGGIAGLVLNLMDPQGPVSLYHSPGLHATNLTCLAMLIAVCVLSVVNFVHPDGARYRHWGILQIAADTFSASAAVFWLQLHGGHTMWPMLLIPIVTCAQRLQLRGTLTVWFFATSAFLLGVVVVDRPMIGAEDVGNAVWISLTVAILCGTQSNAYARQVTQLQQARRQLEHEAGHDPLTGLPNRASLERFAAGLDGRALAVLLLDLNGFKQVNDTLGHAAGDELLRIVGRRIEGLLRTGDMVGRLGGDEFVVLLPDADSASATAVAERLRENIGRPVDIAGQMAQVGVSIGSACRPPGDDATIQLLAAAADTAMYQDKQQLKR